MNDGKGYTPLLPLNCCGISTDWGYAQKNVLLARGCTTYIQCYTVQTTTTSLIPG